MHKETGNTKRAAKFIAVRHICCCVLTLSTLLHQSCSGPANGEYPSGISYDTGILEIPANTMADTGFTTNSTVYVCNSKTTGAYHTAVCRVLNKCKAGSLKLSLKQAKERGYKACKLCH